MGEFRIGRTYAKHVYPDGGSKGGLTPFGLNAQAWPQIAAAATGANADPANQLTDATNTIFKKHTGTFVVTAATSGAIGATNTEGTVQLMSSVDGGVTWVTVGSASAELGGPTPGDGGAALTVIAAPAGITVALGVKFRLFVTLAPGGTGGATYTTDPGEGGITAIEI